MLNPLLGPSASVASVSDDASTSSKVGPGSFKILNIDGSRGGIGPGTLAEWIAGGLSGLMGTGWYWGDPG